MPAPYWYLLIGLLLLATALLATRLQPLPISSSMLYLGACIALGPIGFGVWRLDPVQQAPLLEVVAEIAVIVSLFSAGLKMRVPLSWKAWQVPIRLAVFSMIATVGGVTLLAMWLLHLPLGAALLLGAILAPTDPVLASDVQLAHPHHRHRLRFSLTAEAGLNDGTAFPLVVLGLGLLGLHDLGADGWRWAAVDVLWAAGAGLAIGALFGWIVARLVVYLRHRHQEALGRDEFVALGLLALSYGAAVAVHAYGFLAVFAAGVAVRTIERRHTGQELPPDAAALPPEEAETDEQTAPAHMAQALLVFNEQIERLFEVLLVLLVGSLLPSLWSTANELWFIAALFLLARPAAVLLGLAGAKEPRLRLAMQGWFGIRGIGSIYYLMYAINHGLPADLAYQLAHLTLLTIVASIFIHGISVTPLMRLYERRRSA